jgi:glycosyltransferase involved in cell wall biosynthesis
MHLKKIIAFYVVLCSVWLAAASPMHDSESRHDHDSTSGKSKIIPITAYKANNESLVIGNVEGGRNGEVTSEAKICLNMIVKNEASVITRCLQSVKPLIDYWVIVDTGSTDGTQKIIQEYMKDIPGELHERPWVNFAHNRNEALNFAKDKADYVLIIDADEQLSLSNDFKLPKLDKDFYYIETSYGGTRYKRIQLINNHMDWKWEGVLHETVVSHNAKTSDTLLNITNIARAEGDRSKDPQKYHKDAKVLEAALQENPNSTRYVFYLAQSYKDAGESQKSLEAYQRRIAMKGWDQEVFWSMLQVALLKEKLGKDSADIIESYKQAYTYRPTRAEPLYYLARYLRGLNDHAGSWNAASRGLILKESNDILFVENWVYDYGLLLEYSIAAYWTERYTEALLASNIMLSKASLPPNVRDCVGKNLGWINTKIAETLAKKNIWNSDSSLAEH